MSPVNSVKYAAFCTFWNFEQFQYSSKHTRATANYDCTEHFWTSLDNSMNCEWQLQWTTMFSTRTVSFFQCFLRRLGEDNRPTQVDHDSEPWQPLRNKWMINETINCVAFLLFRSWLPCLFCTVSERFACFFCNLLFCVFHFANFEQSHSKSELVDVR